MLPNVTRVAARLIPALCRGEDVIPATGGTKAEIAQLLGISRQHLDDILRERKPVSPAMAVRLGKLFGDGDGVWVRTQAAYDTWNAKRQEEVSKIPTLRVRQRRLRRRREGWHTPGGGAFDILERMVLDASERRFDQIGFVL